MGPLRQLLLASRARDRTVTSNNFLQDFDRFSAAELHDFVEPKLLDPKFEFGNEAIEILLAGTPTYDEYHLVYAIVILAKFAPEKIALKLPGFLLHDLDSVRCAAVNAINQLDPAAMSEQLVDEIERIKKIAGSDKFINEVKLMRKRDQTKYIIERGKD